MNYIYRFINYDDVVIYIGKTGNIKNRMRQHFTRGHLPPECYEQIARIEYAKVGTEYNAEIYETFYIETYHPIFNTDKKYKEKSDDIRVEMPKIKWEPLYFERCDTGILFHEPNIPLLYLNPGLRHFEQIKEVMSMNLRVIKYHPYLLAHSRLLQKVLGEKTEGALLQLYTYVSGTVSVLDSDLNEILGGTVDEQILSNYIAFQLDTKRDVPQCFGPLLACGFIQYQYKDIFSVPILAMCTLKKLDFENGLLGK